MLWTLGLYAAFMIIVGLLTRRHRSGDDFLMAGRRAGPIAVAASLFTLIGGGELVTLTALAYLHGPSAIALFLGYGLAFLFIGVVAPRLRKLADQDRPISLPDYVDNHYGATAGSIGFILSLFEIFALLVLQFTAGGELLTALFGIPYATALLLIGALGLVYLSLGGLRTVFATDQIQGLAMVCLMPLLLWVVSRSAGSSSSVTEISLSPLISLGIVLTGFFVGASSADVWQRVYAARDDGTARAGFVLGAVVLMGFGVLLVFLGIGARTLPYVESADTAFFEVVTENLPPHIALLAAVFVFSAIMSTADTEMFLLGGMLHRKSLQIIRKPNRQGDLADNETVSGTLAWMLIATALAATAAFILRDLITVYTWLLSAVMVMAGPLILGLFISVSKRAFVAGSAGGLAILVGLALFDVLTLDNCYLIVIPSLVLTFIGRAADSGEARN